MTGTVDEVRPGLFVGLGVKPTCVTPEPGWWTQCRHDRCPGFWRTGLGSRADALELAMNHWENCK